MADTFALKKFSDLNLNDSFFDSLKTAYPGTNSTPSFTDWFLKKSKEDRTALVFQDDDGLGAFISLKQETESLPLQDSILSKKLRLKISTIKIADRFRGQRLGEGSIGLVLWQWQRLGVEEIYVTVFDQQELLISQLTRYGFIKVGYNPNGEGVYLRSRNNIDYSDPYKSFPFINPNFENAGYLCVEDNYHDTLFPYSELKNTLQTSVALNVRNGLSKIYVGAQFTPPPYKVGEPIFIYRIHTGSGVKRYKSCLTSFCIVTDVIAVKRNEHIAKQHKKRLPHKNVRKPFLMRFSALKGDIVRLYPASAFRRVLWYVNPLDDTVPERTPPFLRECVIDGTETAVKDRLIFLYR